MAKFSTWIATLACAASIAVLPAQNSGNQNSGNQNSGDSPARKAGTPVKADVKIATVDIEKAISQYGFAVKEDQRIATLKAKFNDELAELRKNIEAMEAQKPVYKRGSMELEELLLQIRSAKRVYDDIGRLRQAQLEREGMRYELMVFEDMDYAIAQVARQQGIDIVLRRFETDDRPLSESSEPDLEMSNRLSRLSRRSVWYASGAVDLTPDLVRYLQRVDVHAERLKVVEAAAKKRREAAAAKAARDSGNQAASERK